jgi:hypothetical protein
MILVDAGPLIALCNRSDPYHAVCITTLASLPHPLLTTWTAFGEAMHMVGEMSKRIGLSAWPAQASLWGLIDTGAVLVAEPTVHTMARMRSLMEKYRDMPMDLADASLVALAEERGLDRVFTLDSDFEVYRLPGKKRFRLEPS